MIKIVAVAVRFGDVVVSLPEPNRHHHVIHAYTKQNGRVFPDEQGFLTSKGQFVGRKEALRIASHAAQVRPRLHGQYDGPELFSEDLW